MDRVIRHPRQTMVFARILFGLSGAAVFGSPISGCRPNLPGSESSRSKKKDAAPPASASGAGGAAKALAGATHEKPTLVVFGPNSPTVELSFGRFGPCEVGRDPAAHLTTAYCERVGGPEREEILFLFYLRGYYPAKLTAENIANVERPEPDMTVIDRFTLPNPSSGNPEYFLTLSSVSPARHAGKAWIAKVASLNGSVYSIWYSHPLSGSLDQLPELARKWLAENAEPRKADLARLVADASWIPYMEKDLKGAAPR